MIFNNIVIPTKHTILDPAANGAWFIGSIIVMCNMCSQQPFGSLWSWSSSPIMTVLSKHGPEIAGLMLRG